MARLDYDRVATILVESIYFGDVPTAKRWGLSTRTIERYRKRLNEDDKLSGFVALKKERFESNWAEEIPAAIRNGTRFLIKSFQEADPKDADSIHAVAGAMKILAEIGLTKEIIDVRLGRYNRENGEEDKPMDSRSLSPPTE